MKLRIYPKSKSRWVWQLCWANGHPACPASQTMTRESAVAAGKRLQAAFNGETKLRIEIDEQ